MAPVSGAASAVSSSPIAPSYDGSKPSISFESANGRIRLVTRLGQDLEIDPDKIDPMKA